MGGQTYLHAVLVVKSSALEYRRFGVQPRTGSQASKLLVVASD